MNTHQESNRGSGNHVSAVSGGLRSMTAAAGTLSVGAAFAVPLVFCFVVSFVFLGCAGCDQIDDVARDVLKGHDAGAVSDAHPTPPPVCATNADCRTFSDYCTGCACRALGAKEADPVCGGPGVQCLVDPCRSQTATCQDGRCVLGTACGPKTCAAGTTCCNASCGICTAPGGACTQQFCQ